MDNINCQIFVKHLDLTSIKSIIKFSDTLSSEFDEIYALVNNAGIFHHPQYLTEDGFEITLQTNYLGKNEVFYETNSLIRIFQVILY